MMKKAMCIILASLLIFGIVGCGKSDGIVGSNAKIYGMLSTEKYMLDKAIDSEENTTLNFAGIRNETQSAQLTFTAKVKITTFDLITADLKENGGDATISKDLFDVYAEKYIEIYNPFISDASYLSDAGFYPDALVPLDRYKKRAEDRVEKGNNQALWIDVNIPSDAKAGTYKGNFKLLLNEEETEISVTLKIYNLDMPEKVNAPTLFDIWYQNIGYGEGDNLDENTYQTYYEFLWTKRLNGTSLPPQYTSNMKDWVAYVETIWNNPKVTGYRIPSPSINQNLIRPKIEGQYTDEQITAAREKVKDDLKSRLEYILDRNLELRKIDGQESADLLKKAFFYYEDEPSRGPRTDCVKIFCAMLHKAKKELAADYSEEFTANPDLHESLMGVDEICPSNYFFDNSLTVSENEDGTPNYDLSDGLTWWCPEADYAFDKAAKRESILKRQALGEKVWWYLCVSNTPRPSYYVESLPINIRMMSWQQYRWNVEGLLYWDISNYTSGKDMYEDIQSGAYGGGEGILVYPGARYGMKTPVSSWRLEQIRLGQQDLELFYMLDAFLKNAGSEKTANDVAVEMGATMYEGTTIFRETTSAQLEDHRLWLLDVLEQFNLGNGDNAMQKINKLFNK